MPPNTIPARKTDVPSAALPPGVGETFGVGMRQNMMEFDAHDLDRDRFLDFNEFSALVREREMGIFTEEVLRHRFGDMDQDSDGIVSMKEYVLWCLRDALRRSRSRVRDLFLAWDEDYSGCIDRKEWRNAMRALGIDAHKDDLNAIFDEFDYSYAARAPAPIPAPAGARSVHH